MQKSMCFFTRSFTTPPTYYVEDQVMLCGISNKGAEQEEDQKQHIANQKECVLVYYDLVVNAISGAWRLLCVFKRKRQISQVSVIVSLLYGKKLYAFEYLMRENMLLSAHYPR